MEKITISEMAKLHGISRQTLIYYDKIGLFKPESVDSNNRWTATAIGITAGDRFLC